MSASGTEVKFTVTIVYNGLERQLDVNGHQALQAVLEHAMNLFDISQNRHLLALYDTENHEFTELNASATDSGLSEGTKLVLRQSQVRGG
jgi:hypothetical protein